MSAKILKNIKTYLHNVINVFKVFTDDRGTLVPVEFRDKVPFKPIRIFYVKDVPVGTERGMHAHFRCKQYLICQNGAVLVRLFDGFNEKEIYLGENQGFYIPELIWDSQVFLKENTILLVLASTNYDHKDYINDIDNFIKIKSKNAI